MSTTTAPDYRMTSSRYGRKLHTTTCKKAKAGTPVHLADLTPTDLAELGQASCCKPAMPKATNVAKARAGAKTTADPVHKSFTGTDKVKHTDPAKAAPKAKATKKAPAKKATTKRAPAAPVLVRFHHDDKPLPDSQNKISSVAYYFTKGIDGDDPRISTIALRDILTTAGVEDIEGKPWGPVTLANGVKLHATAL